MKKAVRVLNYILLFSIFYLSSHYTVGQTAPIKAVKLPADLDLVLRKYEDHWKNYDAQGLANLFTDDGYILRPYAPPVKGRLAISEAYEESGGMLFLNPFNYEISGGLAIILGGYSVEEGGKEVGKFTLTLKKVGGKWMIFSDMDNPNQR